MFFPSHIHGSEYNVQALYIYIPSVWGRTRTLLGVFGSSTNAEVPPRDLRRRRSHRPWSRTTGAVRALSFVRGTFTYASTCSFASSSTCTGTCAYTYTYTYIHAHSICIYIYICIYAYIYLYWLARSWLLFENALHGKPCEDVELNQWTFPCMSPDAVPSFYGIPT